VKQRQAGADLVPIVDRHLHDPLRPTEAGLGKPAGPGNLSRTETERHRSLRVVGDTPVPLALVGVRVADGDDRAAAQSRRGIGGVGYGQASVAEVGARADDPRPDAADDDVEALRLCPRERCGDRDRLHVAVVARCDCNRNVEQPPCLQGTNRVRERDGERATSQLDVGDALFRAYPRARWSDLAVQPAADDRHPVERLGERPAFLDRPVGRLTRRVGQGDHVSVLVRAQVETAGEVDVEDVEPARSELERPRLDVDDHDVPLLDRPGLARIREAWDAVDLAADQLLEPLVDGGHGPPAQAQGHLRPVAPRRRCPG
jgi:hypothetical protein